MSRIPRLWIFGWLLAVWASTGFGGGESYHFKALWPKPQQPWYFYFPAGVAVDGAGNIDVLDKMHCIIKMNAKGEVLGTVPVKEATAAAGIAIDRKGNIYVVYPTGADVIVKYDQDGKPLRRWGKAGAGDGEFHLLAEGYGCMAVDRDGNVYVADTLDNRIEKFDSDGKFLAKWGAKGDGDAEFNSPTGVAVDGAGEIFVTDAGNGRVEKFGADMKFAGKWGVSGTGAGEFNKPGPIAADGNNVYVADFGKAKGSRQRIQKFDGNGKLLMAWGNGDGAKPMKFDNVAGMTMDGNGGLLTTEVWGFFVRRCSAQGEFTDCWSTGSKEDGKMHWPYAVAMDGKGDLYMTDGGTARVLKYDSQGNFITQWKTTGFPFPIGIALSGSSEVYVQCWGGHILKYDGNGKLLATWGKEGTGDGEFHFGNGAWLATDKDGNVYVADKENHRIQKLDANGNFLLKWGKKGTADGEFDEPCGLAVNKATGDVYVAELGNHRVQKFDKDGKFLCKWGSKGTEAGEFMPMDGFLSVALDKAGNVYVADKLNNRIQKFDADGKFLCKWGSFGSGEGEFGSPTDVAVDDAGDVYVIDSLNSRVQVFSPGK